MKDIKLVHAALKRIHKAYQCTDIGDCSNAIDELKEFAKQNYMVYTPAMRKRLYSLHEKRAKLLERKGFCPIPLQ